jgi:two-component system, NtrC family, sensor kinase
MLQHSRTSNGVKEPTDINALADEYLRISLIMVCGLKTNRLMLTLKQNFDPDLPAINVIPQDIGTGIC